MLFSWVVVVSVQKGWAVSTWILWRSKAQVCSFPCCWLGSYCFPLIKSVTYSQMSIESNMPLIRVPAIWGGGGLNVPPQATSGDAAQPWNLLKGNREVIPVNHGDGGRCESGLFSPPPHCRLVNSSWSFLDAFLFTQFVLKIIEWEPGGETWSCVNYSSFLLLCSTERTHRGVVWLKDLKGVLGLEMRRAWGAWFKVRDKTQGPPAKSSFLLKATSTFSDALPGEWAKGLSQPGPSTLGFPTTSHLMILATMNDHCSGPWVHCSLWNAHFWLHRSFAFSSWKSSKETGLPSAVSLSEMQFDR